MLAIVTTHPIQYQTPLWQALAEDARVPFEVWYLTDYGLKPSRDHEFGKTFAWDIDLFSGYPHTMLKTASGAAPTSFAGCRLTERLSQRITQTGVKIVWVQGWQVAAYWQAVWAARSTGVQVWLRAESNDLAPPVFWKMPVKRVALGSLFRRVDQFFCIGTANRRLYKEYGVADDQLHLAPYAVDNERFASQAAELQCKRAEIRRAFNIAEDALCVMFCGKFVLKKRPMDIVNAVSSALARDRSQRIHLLFVGSGELGAELRGACRVLYDGEDVYASKNRNEQVAAPLASFAGFMNQTEISKAYVAADCLVLPSDYGETWGLVVNEAMASGLPCIVSDACGCSEDLGVISPNRTFPVGNVGALADCLLEAAARGTKLRVPPVALSEYTFSKNVDSVVAAYRRALKQSNH